MGELRRVAANLGLDAVDDRRLLETLVRGRSSRYGDRPPADAAVPYVVVLVPSGDSVVVDADDPSLLRPRMPKLRFRVGDRVAARTPTGDTPGEIVRCWYRERDWPPEQWAAYQVKLAVGALTYVPTDDDNTVRLLRPDELATGLISS
ncbi:hypothetical protein JL720_8627 [Aureococcus anophagefferens]|nr:hypothetical protein JL720_8627 [Aureococcus anophagefferens]